MVLVKKFSFFLRCFPSFHHFYSICFGFFFRFDVPFFRCSLCYNFFCSCVLCVHGMCCRWIHFWFVYLILFLFIHFHVICPDHMLYRNYTMSLLSMFYQPSISCSFFFGYCCFDSVCPFLFSVPLHPFESPFRIGSFWKTSQSEESVVWCKLNHVQFFSNS